MTDRTASNASKAIGWSLSITTKSFLPRCLGMENIISIFEVQQLATDCNLLTWHIVTTIMTQILTMVRDSPVACFSHLLWHLDSSHVVCC